MAFEVGIYYKHKSGNMMHILGETDSTQYGTCLFAESLLSGNFIPVGKEAQHAVNWDESSENEWMENFNKQ